MESSWLQVPAWTPSAPSSLHVSSDVFRQEDGKLFPVLQIEWKVATDGKGACLIETWSTGVI